MRKPIQTLSLSLLALGFLLSPSVTPESIRHVASCDGGLDAVESPAVPFGLEFYSQLDDAALAQNKDYWTSYLAQATASGMAARQTIRNGYGLDLPGTLGSTSLSMPNAVVPAGPINAASAAFLAFSPLATYATMPAWNLPGMQPFGSAAPAFATPMPSATYIAPTSLLPGAGFVTAAPPTPSTIIMTQVPGSTATIATIAPTILMPTSVGGAMNMATIRLH